MKRLLLIIGLGVVMTLFGTTAQAAPDKAEAPAPIVVIPTAPKAPVSPDPIATPNASPLCGNIGGRIRCGTKFTNTESRVIVGAALGALGAGGAVACNKNPICLIIVGAGIGAALAYWNAIANQGRCLFWSTFPTSYVTTVRC